MAHPSLAHVDHRPWPLPERPWMLRQAWHDVLFAHWRMPAEVLQEKLPRGLEIETFDGSAWIGVVPFRIVGITQRPVPPVPWVSYFPELNLRTYVRPTGRERDKPGVYFFSLDAQRWLAARTARLVFNLNYFHARMSVRHEDDWVVYKSTRRDAPQGIGFDGRYRPTGAVANPAPGSLEEFLVERYALYAASRRGGVHRIQIHHAPWPLQPAEAEIERNDLSATIDLTLPDEPPLLHFAKAIDTIGWMPERIPT